MDVLRVRDEHTHVHGIPATSVTARAAEKLARVRRERDASCEAEPAESFSELSGLARKVGFHDPHAPDADLLAMGECAYAEGRCVAFLVIRVVLLKDFGGPVPTHDSPSSGRASVESLHQVEPDGWEPTERGENPFSRPEASLAASHPHGVPAESSAERGAPRCLGLTTLH